MKNKPKKCLTVSAFWHIILISRIFGQLPFSIGKPTIMNKLKSKINSAVFFSIYSVMGLITMFAWPNENPFGGLNINTPLAVYIRRIKNAVGFLVMMIILGYTPFRKTNLVTLVSMIQEIDDELKIVNIKQNFNKINWYFYAFFIMGITYLGADLIMRNVCHIAGMGEWIHGMTIITQMVCETHIVSLTWILAERFQILNDYLNEFHISKISSTDFFWITPVGLKNTSLSVVSRIHDKLCILCRKVDNAFAFQLVLIIAQCFVGVILKMYIMLATIFKPIPHCFTTFAGISIVFDFLNVLIIVVFTSVASTKVKTICQVL